MMKVKNTVAPKPKEMAVKSKIHPVAARVRLPQGMVNTSQSDPPPVVPNAGRI